MAHITFIILTHSIYVILSRNLDEFLGENSSQAVFVCGVNTDQYEFLIAFYEKGGGLSICRNEIVQELRMPSQGLNVPLNRINEKTRKVLRQLSYEELKELFGDEVAGLILKNDFLAFRNRDDKRLAPTVPTIAIDFYDARNEELDQAYA